ncbi:hypothetical protein [Streptomyces sp. NPDC001530]|uniref:hypothetical protein n=1 Tax=Streptomyces sp. NPDC001530 TaxID=3364582 RepID=UPI00369E45E1
MDDFTAVCVDALRAHARRYGGEPAANGIERRVTWSPVADARTVCTVVWALIGAVRTAAG